MARLLGVLAGSALAVAALVVFVGIPEFTADKTTAKNTVITLPLQSRPLPPETEDMADVVDPPGDDALDPPAPPTSPSALRASATPAEEPPAALATDPDAETPKPAVESSDDGLNWYAFWSPFRSEIAAAGFVTQLQRVTGLDYRVVKVKPGVYEVAFAYSDDDEIMSNLSQISAATGLDVPEG